MYHTKRVKKKILLYFLLLNRHLLAIVTEVHATEGDRCIPDILQMRKLFLPPKESFKEPPPWNGWNVTSQIQNLSQVF